MENLSSQIEISNTSGLTLTRDHGKFKLTGEVILSGTGMQIDISTHQD